ncbi:cytochrome c oxidase subunit II [Sphingomonas daechungensis]|uniref:cytochrome c oxidase subunit II n=1 Tax=Sphingomonas daechungensis TaxID=1176646 RepID=UPI00378442AC
MKLIAWAIALAAAGLTPAAAQSPQAAQPQAATAAEAAAQPTVANAPGGSTAPANPEAVAMTATVPGHAAPTEVGVPRKSGIGIQEQVTDIGHYAANFHNNWLLLLCVVISLFVLGLLCLALVKFRRGANPTPSRTSHNTVLEVVWTLVPVLILVAIAIPSMRLLSKQYNPPPADLTVKVVGNQWFWTYSYPDNGGFEIVSNQLKEQKDVKPGDRYRTDKDGPPMLAVDERMVIPAGKVVKFLVTSNDVIHAFWVPAFWSKIDANPGQVNQMWVKVDRPGVYFGQCTELCGARHGYMPTAVEVVPPEQFAAWVASKGGTMPGAKPAAAPAAASAEAQPAAPQPATNQAATAQN